MPFYLLLIYSVGPGQYSCLTCTLTHIHSCLAGALWRPVKAEGETQSQREAAGTCKCKHVSPPAPTVSSHCIYQSAGPIRIQSCTPKSYGIGLSQVTHSLVLTLFGNNKGDWWEASTCGNVSINEWKELKALNMFLELLCSNTRSAWNIGKVRKTFYTANIPRISFMDSCPYLKFKDWWANVFGG